MRTPAERFYIREVDPCMCGMRQFDVFDNFEGKWDRAHVGHLNAHDKGHDAVRAILAAERHSEPHVSERAERMAARDPEPDGVNGREDETMSATTVPEPKPFRRTVRGYIAVEALQCVRCSSRVEGTGYRSQQWMDQHVALVHPLPADAEEI